MAVNLSTNPASVKSLLGYRFVITSVCVELIFVFAVFRAYSLYGIETAFFLALAFVLLGGVAFLGLMTSHVQISLDEATVNILLRKRTLKWKGISSVTSFTNGFGLTVLSANKAQNSGLTGAHNLTDVSTLSIVLSVYGNQKEVVEAMLEAAYRANSDVKIDPELLRKYGPPPYGILQPR